MGQGFWNYCCRCVVGICEICVITCKELCEEYERSKLDEAQNPQTNQVQRGERNPCLLGFIITCQIILLIAFILAMVFEQRTHFYFISPNIMVYYFSQDIASK